jgi:hypothetical protein
MQIVNEKKRLEQKNKTDQAIQLTFSNKNT